MWPPPEASSHVKASRPQREQRQAPGGAQLPHSRHLGSRKRPLARASQKAECGNVDAWPIMWSP